MIRRSTSKNAPLRRATLASLALVSASLSLAPACAQQTTPLFTPGDLVVLVEGCGSLSSNCKAVPNGNGIGTGNSTATGYGDNQGAPLTLFQYAPRGTASAQFVNSLVMPQTMSGANFPVSSEYGSSSEGSIQLSGSGQYLTFMGYGIPAATFDANPAAYGAAPSLALAQSGSLTGQSYLPIPRVVVLVDQNGNINSSTAVYNVFNTNNPRSIFTASGSTAYLSGQGAGSDATGGVFYTPLNILNSAPIPITGLDTTANTLSQDTRTLQIVNGKLYVSVDTKGGSNSARDYIGTLANADGSLPTSTVGGPVMLPGFGNTGGTGKETITTGPNSNGNNLNAGLAINVSSSNFFFASPSVLYVADTGNPKNNSNTSTLGNGGLEKWINSAADGSGTWSLAYTLYKNLNIIANTNTSGTSGLYGLAGTVSGGQAMLYATNATLADLDPTFLYGITDTLSFTSATQAAAESFTQLAVAPPDSNFKGVSFAPTVPAPVAPITMPAGFTPNSVDTNGTAVINGGTLQLTTVGNTNQAASAFAPAPVNIQSFTNDFTFQITSPGADGFMFVLQNKGVSALGGYGANLGFAPGYGNPAITPSAGIKFDLYSNAGEGSDSTGLYLNGASPTTPSTDLTSTGIDLHSGHPFQVHMTYNGTALAVTLTDTITQAQATQRYTVNLPAVLGAGTAYVGFTAGTGGYTATQTILNWTFTPGTSVPTPVLPAETAASIQTISISDASPAAAIYYTLDGSTPTVQSTLYSGSFAINITTTVKAIAVLNGVSSQIASTTYDITAVYLPVTAPTITSAPIGTTNTYTATLADTTPGATIFYTTDGTAPNPFSPVYTAPIPVYYTQTIKAFATLSGIASNVATQAITVTPINSIQIVNVFPQGSVSLNGSAKLSNGILSLTDGSTNEAGSAFSPSVVGVQSFYLNFMFQITPIYTGEFTYEPIADGLTFVFQNQGPTALGAYGEYLGYGSPSAPIGKSVAVKFDLYDNAGEGSSSTGIYLNGATPTVPAVSTGSVSLQRSESRVGYVAGDFFNINMSYDGSTLTVSIMDEDDGLISTHSYTVDLPAIVGANTAFIGLTGSTGGLTATQSIYNLQFNSTAPAQPTTSTPQ